MKNIIVLFILLTTSLSAQTGFSNWECLYNSPEAGEIFIAGGSVFTAEVNAALNEVCLNFELEELENSTEEPDGAFIICNGEFIEIDTLNFNEDSFNLFLASLNCAEFYQDSVNVNLEPETGFNNWDCLYNSPEAGEIFIAGGTVFTAEVNAALNEVCSNFELEEVENSTEEPDGAFIICNGEFIEIDTLNFNEDSFNLFLASLDCAEAEDWLNEDNDTLNSEPESYFSWDCIYNYPEANELYMNFGNPEASVELNEFCLAVANGDWMWGDDPNQWPITCEEGTSIATVEFETAGFGYQEEVSWSIENYEGEVGLTPVCLEDGCSQFNMFDSWGDGWGGITFTINSPNGILLTGSLEDGFVQSLPFGLNTAELCFDLTEVENPDAFSCFEDVFPGIGNIDFGTMYPNMEMTNEDLFFIIEDTDVDFSVLTENGIEIPAQEMDGYLLFGPISIDELISFVLGLGMDDSSIPWGFFRPATNEALSQGFINKENMELPNNFSASFEFAATVVDVILGSPDHTTLATAVSLAGLLETLSSDGPFTVFAPTDAAFEALPEGTLDALIAAPAELTQILTHHVHAGLVFSTGLIEGMMVPTVNGTNLEVNYPMGIVHIDNAMITITDLPADNGVVHIIDAVLLPSIGLSINESIFLENNSEYLYSLDVLGKRVASDSRGIIIFDKYSSGKVVKRFVE